MVVTESGKRRAIEVHGAGRPLAHGTNSRQGEPFEGVRHSRAGADGKEQFVIIAAVETHFEWIVAGTPPAFGQGHSRNLAGSDPEIVFSTRFSQAMMLLCKVDPSA